MTDFSNGETVPESKESDSGARFRERQRINLAFGQIIKELEVEDPSPIKPRMDLLLDAISEGGVAAVAETARASFHSLDEPYIPAEESEVRSFLEWMHTNPPIKINDIGSVDRELVIQLRLKKDAFEDQLRDLVAFLDVDQKTEVSVLDLPGILREMDELELSAIIKSLILTVIDEHGISFVYDINDKRVWNYLRALVEELSRPYLRDYSNHLRTKTAISGERTPMRDVYATIDERVAIRESAFNMARENVNASDVERRRMFEAMPKYMRPLVQRFLEDLEAARKPEA